MSYAEQYERWIRRVETEPEKVFAEDSGEFTDFDLWLKAAKQEIDDMRLFRAALANLAKRRFCKCGAELMGKNIEARACGDCRQLAASARQTCT